MGRDKTQKGDMARQFTAGVHNTETKTIPMVIGFRNRKTEEMVVLGEIREEIVKRVGTLSDVPNLGSLNDVLSREPVKEHCLIMSGDSGKNDSFGITQYGIYLMPLFAYNICKSHETGMPSYMLCRALRCVRDSSNYSPLFVNSEIVRKICCEPGIEAEKLFEIMDETGIFDHGQETPTPLHERRGIFNAHLTILSRDDQQFKSLIRGYDGDEKNGELHPTETGLVLCETYGNPTKLFFEGDGKTRAEMEQCLELLYDEGDQIRTIYTDALDNYLKICPYAVGHQNNRLKFRIISEISNNGSEMEPDTLAKALKITKRKAASILNELVSKKVLINRRQGPFNSYFLQASFQQYIDKKGLSYTSVRDFHKAPI
ncbi:MAG: hypothetical protein JW754_05005 [Candidatus Aenigmarchaeota archaeon]|nr:hypothetical protein [Candidatus Aenigmarchaeota archaeon]